METSSGNHHLPLNNCSSVLILDETVSVGSLSVGSDVHLFSSQNSRLGLEQSILHKPLFPHITPIPYLLALPQADHLMLPFRGMSTIHLAYLELWNPLWFFFLCLGFSASLLQAKMWVHFPPWASLYSRLMISSPHSHFKGPSSDLFKYIHFSTYTDVIS